MTDHEPDVVQVDETSVADPPTVDDTLKRPETGNPGQAPTTHASSDTAEEVATLNAGGEVVDRRLDSAPDIEGPNSA